MGKKNNKKELDSTTGVSLDPQPIETNRVLVGSTKAEEDAYNAKITKEKVEEILKLVEYNNSLFEVEDRVKDVIINGNRLMVRLFEHIPYLPGSKMTMRMPIQTQIPTEGGRTKTVDALLQNIPMGVIVKMDGTRYSPEFKERFNVGDIVVIAEGIDMVGSMFFFNPALAMSVGNPSVSFENYFAVPESAIKSGYSGNQQMYKLEEWLTEEELKIAEEIKSSK